MIKFGPKTKFILLIILTLVLALAAVFLIFFNRGTLSVTAKAPYDIYIPGYTSFYCEEDLCEVELPARKYEMQFRKADHFSQIEEIRIPTFGQITKDIDFKAVPTLFEQPYWIGDSFPFQIYSKLPLLTDPDNEIQVILQDIEDLQNVALSTDQTHLIVETSKDVKLYQNGEAQELSIEPGDIYSFVDDSNNIVFLPTRRRSKNQPLNIIQNASSSPELQTSFVRTIKQGEIFASEEQIAILDKTATSGALYILDQQSKTRERLFPDQNVRNFKWLDNGQYLVQLEAVYLNNQPLGLETTIQNITQNKDQLLIIEFILSADREAEAFNLISYDLANGQTEFITSLDLPLKPTRIEMENADTVKILSGNRVYTLELDL